MNPARRPIPRALRAALVVMLLGGLTACAGGGPTQRLRAAGPDLQAGLPYWSSDGATLRLDACVPDDSGRDRAAVVILHGGGFTSGSRDEAGTRAICTTLAEQGLVGFSIDYRLVPEATYPAQVQDLQHALEWVRAPAQVTRFGLDPKRIALLGSSAGAIIAQEAATAGSGPLTGGTRVAAVVSLSGVSLLNAQAERLGASTPDARRLVLAYLGCSGLEPAACPRANAASAALAVSRGDPPMLLVNGRSEIVPAAQPRLMASLLRASKVPVETVYVAGSGHGLALLDDAVRARIREFLRKHL